MSLVDIPSVIKLPQMASSGNISSSRIDEYARSMFRFEHLHGPWIEKCARYIRHVFGGRIRGATVIDYAFGRGNWAAAFARAGARKVLAIDASKTNVERFAAYCRHNGLASIEVIQGNVVEDSIARTADIVWVYGILHHVPRADRFMRELSSMLSPNGEMLVYAYDKGSLRQIIVDAVRDVLYYEDEASFRGMSFMLTPAARLRARDDLTAPHIRWYTEKELADLGEAHGLFLKRRVQSFQQFFSRGTRKHTHQEFSPHHFVFSMNAGNPRVKTSMDGKGSVDAHIIQQMIEPLLRGRFVSRQAKRAIAVGLLNTHFSALDKEGSIKSAAFQDFLFLLYAARSNEISPANIPPLARRMYRLALEKSKLGKVHMAGRSNRDSAISSAIALELVRF